MPEVLHFLLKAFVSRVMRRMPMRIERFCRSTCEVQILSLSGVPITVTGFASTTSAGLQRRSPSADSAYIFTNIA